MVSQTVISPIVSILFLKNFLENEWCSDKKHWESHVSSLRSLVFSSWKNLNNAFVFTIKTCRHKESSKLISFSIIWIFNTNICIIWIVITFYVKLLWIYFVSFDHKIRCTTSSAWHITFYLQVIKKIFHKICLYLYYSECQAQSVSLIQDMRSFSH